MFQAGFVAIQPERQRAFGEFAGGGHEGLLVEEREGLQRSVGAVFANGAELAGGGVEGKHRRRSDGTFPKRVEAAAIEVCTLTRLIVVASGQFRPKSWRLIGFHARPAELLDEQAAGR